MAHRLYICDESVKRYTNEYYDMIMKENQQTEQILYKSLYENLLSQYSKYVTDIETPIKHKRAKRPTEYSYTS